MEGNISKIYVWRKNGGKCTMDTDLEVNIAGIQVWSKNGGEYINDSGLDEERRYIYQGFRSGERMEVNISRIQGCKNAIIIMMKPA